MPKYWGETIFILGSFPEVGQEQKTEKKQKKTETTPRMAHAKPHGPQEKLKVGNNNGQLCGTPLGRFQEDGTGPLEWVVGPRETFSPGPVPENYFLMIL